MPAIHAWKSLGIALAVFGVGGCFGVDGAAEMDDEGDSAPVAAEQDVEAEIEVDDCSLGESPETVANTIAIAEDLADGLREIDTVGEPLLAFGAGLLDLDQLLGFRAGGIRRTLPEAFVFRTGEYEADFASEATLTVRLRLSQDTSFGRAGDLVEANLFRLDTFLEEATVSRLDGAVEIDYVDASRWAEFLGLPADPAQPLHLEATSVPLLRANLDRAVGVESKAVISTSRGQTNITFDLSKDAIPPSLLEWASAGSTAFELTGLAAERPATRQAASLVAHELQWGEAGLSGEARFLVEGGAFDVWIDLAYSQGTIVEQTVGCVPQ